jgi:hypothetical protein
VLDVESRRILVLLYDVFALFDDVQPLIDLARGRGRYRRKALKARGDSDQSKG